MITVQVVGQNAWVDRVSTMQVRVQQDALNAASGATLDGLTVMKKLCPVRTGKLRAGCKTRQSKATSKFLFLNELYNDVAYAIFVAYGTRFQRPQDFVTPAIVEARKSLLRRLQAIQARL